MRSRQNMLGPNLPSLLGMAEPTTILTTSSPLCCPLQSCAFARSLPSRFPCNARRTPDRRPEDSAGRYLGYR
jgi:hypothetical protein